MTEPRHQGWAMVGILDEGPPPDTVNETKGVIINVADSNTLKGDRQARNVCFVACPDLKANPGLPTKPHSRVTMTQ